MVCSNSIRFILRLFCTVLKFFPISIVLSEVNLNFEWCKRTITGSLTPLPANEPGLHLEEYISLITFETNNQKFKM